MTTARLPVTTEMPVVPTRQQLRAALCAHARPNTVLALSWVVFDVLVFIALSVLIVLPIALPWKIVASIALGLWIARLFVLGHDACHQALTSHRALNRWIGRLAFLPSLTPYSLWELGHNVAHHGSTNLRGRDCVWVPLSVDEYRAHSPLRRWLERVYRSGWGPGLYFLVEQWWRMLYSPWGSEAASVRKIFAMDRRLVNAFGVSWISALGFGAWWLGTSPVEAIILGWLIPFLAWNTLIGFTTYVHHTEPTVRWYDDGAAWAAARPYVSTTLHVRAPLLDWLAHHILQHPAHHLDMTIPFYRLRDVQHRLAALVPGHVQTRTLTWRYYWSVARTCKVYDYDRFAWLPFPTTDAHANEGSTKADT